jgi:alkylhydroperoxidase family enzyme
MPWIKTVPFDDADPSLRAAIEAQRALYPPEYRTPVAGVDDRTPGIVASHTLIPEALRHAFATFGALMAPDLPLDRRQHELIATAVSLTNRCHY